jgi:hypothetical protein
MRPAFLLATVVSLAGCAYALADIDQPLLDRDLDAVLPRAEKASVTSDSAARLAATTTSAAATSSMKTSGTKSHTTKSVETSKSKGAAPRETGMGLAAIAVGLAAAAL